MVRLYRWLLFLYPADYRIIFGAEMAEVFGEALDALRNRGVWPWVIFCLRELAGLLWGASSAHMRLHSGWLDRVKSFIIQGRAAVPRLVFVFAAIVAVIEVLKSFLPHRHASQWILWNEFLLAILAGLTVAFGGAVVWAFLFGRTGLHRIANIDTRSPRK